MKRIFLFALCCITVAGISACKNSSSSSEEAAGESVAEVADSAAVEAKISSTMEKLANLPEEPEFDIITNLGTIRVKLYSGTPKHRENFAKLAFDGFYNGILFHRVINGFMIQSGDPLTKDPENAQLFGTGGPGYTIPAEFVAEYRHKKGALAAARRGDSANPYKESSGSQFYIVQNEAACAPLDGDYTVFGETVSGLEIVDKIAGVDTDMRDRPLQEVKIITVKLAE